MISFKEARIIVVKARKTDEKYTSASIIPVNNSQTITNKSANNLVRNCCNHLL